jgi:hypothetical protein
LRYPKKDAGTKDKGLNENIQKKYDCISKEFHLAIVFFYTA